MLHIPEKSLFYYTFIIFLIRYPMNTPNLILKTPIIVPTKISLDQSCFQPIRKNHNDKNENGEKNIDRLIDRYTDRSRLPSVKNIN